jgi:hypothetical protein
MDNAALYRTAPVANATTVRADLPPARQSVASELPPQKAVQAAGQTDAVRVDISSEALRFAEDQARADALRRRTDVDRDAASLVTRWVDDSGEVERQFPDERVLKSRAYRREMDRAELRDDGPAARS